MNSIEKVREIFQTQNDVVRTRDLATAKIYYKDIIWLMEQGYIEKVKRGVYHWVDKEEFSEVSLIKKLFPDAILCMYSGLFYHGYSDRTPLEWNLAVNKDSAKSRFKIDYPFVKPYYLEADILEIGKIEIEIDGYMMYSYDKERLICDCIKYAGKMDKEIFNKAIQSYVIDQKKQIGNLTEYAKKLRVLKRVKDLIGVWI